MPTLILFLQLIAWEMRYEKARGRHRFLLHHPLTEEERVYCALITLNIHKVIIEVYDSS